MIRRLTQRLIIIFYFKEPTTDKSSQAQITAFEDTWHWTQQTERAYQDIINSAPADVVEMIRALRQFIRENDMMAYLTMMCIRLIELRRVLKDTGSIYLHCDPTASHYLKILMDTIFRVKNFRNEIVWHYRRWTNVQKQFQRMHDIILRYSKSHNYYFKPPLRKYSQTGSGIHSDGTKYDKKKDLTSHNDWWIDLSPVNTMAKERLGYPTQKPITLLERIIKASSNKGDIILDPFCGCGTTICSAQKLKRKWIGIDITHLAVNLMKWRLKDMSSLEVKKDYRVIGEPEDISGVQALSDQNKYQFQWWACSLVNARPYGDKKKGADGGIDGYIYFNDYGENKKILNKKAIVQVKGGKVASKPTVAQIRDLCHVIDREKAEIGIFICMQEPTKAMITEAVKKGYYDSTGLNNRYPKIQIFTIEELLDGKKPQLPLIMDYHKKAERLNRKAEFEEDFFH